jgi:outer membrane protein assembly factor BamE (lipoprotein component of BamABCDE complex)
VPVQRAGTPAADSRADIDATTAPQIVAGHTTRTDVLLMLGEPDGRAANDRWFTYRTRVSRGGWHWAEMEIGPGVVAAMPVGEWDTVRRLLVRFDDSGIVSSVEFREKNCTGCRNVLDARGSGDPAP